MCPIMRPRFVRFSTILVHTSIVRPMQAGFNNKWPELVPRDTQYFLLLSVGQFLDHSFMLIFATVATLALSAGWDRS